MLPTDIEIVRTSVKIGLLDSALAAPFAGFGDVSFYPQDAQRLGVRCARIAMNHPFPDENRRTGFLAMLRLAEMNDIVLDFDDTIETAMVIDSVAAGEMDESEFRAWVGEHIAIG